MYKAVNKNVILKEGRGFKVSKLPRAIDPRTKEELDVPQGSATVTMKVFDTNEESKEVKGKTVVTNFGFLMDLGDGYWSVDLEAIKAVKD